MAETIPEDVRLFILTSILSVPHLEATLRLRSETHEPWRSARLAQRLYVGDKFAEQLLSGLCAAGILVTVEREHSLYRYQTRSDGLRQKIDRIAETHA